MAKSVKDVSGIKCKACIRYGPKIKVKFEVPPWIKPLDDEPLGDYSRRLAETIHVKQNEKVILGGQSFGGQVALELARYIPSHAVVLIASGNNKDVITPQFRMQQLMVNHLGKKMIQSMMTNVAIPFFKAREGLNEADTNCLIEMSQSFDHPFFVWASKSILDWDFKLKDLETPVYHIHGANDYIIPVPVSDNLLLLPEGRHLINFTHADEISDWLLGIIKGLEKSQHNLS